MFNNPFRKYQTGGSVTDEQRQEATEFVTWIKSNVEGFKDKSVEEIAKSLIDMRKSEEGEKSYQDLYKKFKSSKSKKSKFEDGGKFQQFICKHARGGLVNCGCGGMTLKAADGDQVPEIVPAPTDSTVIAKGPYKGYTIYNTYTTTAPDGSVARYTVAKDNMGQYLSKQEINGNTAILGGYLDENRAWTPEGDVDYTNNPYMQKLFTFAPVQKKQPGGNLAYERSESPNNLRISRRQALDLAQAQNEDGLDRKTARQTYRQLKNDLLASGYGWRARRQEARRQLVSGNNPTIVVDQPSIQLPTIEGPRGTIDARLDGVAAVAPIKQPVVVTPKPIVKQPIRSSQPVIEQQYVPSIRESIATKNQMSEDFRQFMYERGLYDRDKGAYRPNQAGQAYQNWLWGEFQKYYDPETRGMKDGFYHRYPTEAELASYENPKFAYTGGQPTSMSAQRRAEMGIDDNLRRYYRPEYMLADQDPYTLSAEQRRDIAKYPTAIGNGSNDIYNDVAKMMTATIAIPFTAQAIEELAAMAPEIWDGVVKGSKDAIAKFKDLATQQARGMWNGNTAQARVGTWNSRTPYGIRENISGQYVNPGNIGRYTSGTDLSRTAENIGRALQFKQGGQIEKPINRFKNILHK